MSVAQILVIYAHAAPRWSRVNEPLRRALAALDGVAVHDLYRRYPDFDVDIAAEQAALTQADLIVWQYPVHWYAMPSLMKEWVDRVLAHGWAYGRGGDALRGKRLLALLSTGSAAEAYRPGAYHDHTFETFLAPVRQTAVLCQLEWLPPRVFHGAHRATPESIERHVAQVRDDLKTYMDTGAWTPAKGD